MREILFKGKTNNSWVQGLLAYKNGKWYISNQFGLPFTYEIKPETICQYTGATDKNGNKIWENDIIQKEDIAAPVKFGRYCSSFDMGNNNIGFYVDFPDDTFLRVDLGYWNEKIIVIGNMHDEPELLQEVPK